MREFSILRLISQHLLTSLLFIKGKDPWITRQFEMSCVHLMLESPDHSVSNGRAHHAFNLLLGLPTLFVMRIQMIHFLYTYFYTTTKEQKYDK